MIYSISEKLQAALELKEDGSIDAEHIDGVIVDLQFEVHETVVDAIKAARNIEAQKSGIDAEIERLKARSSALGNKVSAIKSSVIRLMTETETDKINDALFTVTSCKSRETVLVTDTDLIPDEYKKVKTVISDSKTDIFKALKAGEQVPGAELVRGANYLKIS